MSLFVKICHFLKIKTKSVFSNYELNTWISEYFFQEQQLFHKWEIIHVLWNEIKWSVHWRVRTAISQHTNKYFYFYSDVTSHSLVVKSSSWWTITCCVFISCYQVVKLWSVFINIFWRFIHHILFHALDCTIFCLFLFL